MAVRNGSDNSPSARPASHPLANPGYGKQSAPEQLPRSSHDFADLPPREAAVGAYIDRLPEGADISVKTLAKNLPYGQCALRTTLNNLTLAGHLRRGRECVGVTSGGARWVTRTWFSRTPRDDAWWAAFTRGTVPTSTAATQPKPLSSRPQTRSRAMILLAALSRTEPMLSMSRSQCAELAPLVEDWLERGSPENAVVKALTDRLPTPVHSPVALLRRRLTDNPLPEPTPTPPPVSEVMGPQQPLRLVECAKCRDPLPPDSPGGMCGPCRGATVRDRDTGPTLAADAVQAAAAGIRAAMFQKREEIKLEERRRTLV
jgi:hypothetical protein